MSEIKHVHSVSQCAIFFSNSGEGEYTIIIIIQHKLYEPVQVFRYWRYWKPPKSTAIIVNPEAKVTIRVSRAWNTVYDKRIGENKLMPTSILWKAMCNGMAPASIQRF